MRFLDHFIIGKGEPYSVVEAGLSFEESAETDEQQTSKAPIGRFSIRNHSHTAGNIVGCYRNTIIQ